MHICNYCGRTLKENYEKCPGCGGSSFKNKAYLGEIIIKEPPKGGYKIDNSNYKRKIRNINIANTIILIIMIIFSIPFFPFILMPILIAILVIGILSKEKKLAKKNIKRIEELRKKGMLVKAIDYKIVDTGEFIGNKKFKCIKVVFKNSNGIEIPLFSETKYDIDKKQHKTVDLLIDPNDYSNYFIDFEIY